MSQYIKSDYAINVRSQGIMYQCADGTKCIDLNSFLSENPTLSEDDFGKWKQISDDMYLDESRADWRNTHKAISFEQKGLEHVLSGPSAEDEYIEDIDRTEAMIFKQKRLELINQALRTLNKVQRRRFWLHVVKRMTVRRIARLEGNVSYQSIHRSIRRAYASIHYYVETMGGGVTKPDNSHI